jgi:hypothetical protein
VLACRVAHDELLLRAPLFAAMPRGVLSLC